MTDNKGLIAVFRKGVLVHTGNPIPPGFLREYDTVHLGIGVFDAEVFAGIQHLRIIGAGDGRDADPGTLFVGKLGGPRAEAYQARVNAAVAILHPERVADSAHARVDAYHALTEDPR